jgi:hypothetical protein
VFVVWATASDRPLFVTLLLYLDDEWPLNFDAETLILDSSTGTGVFEKP